MYKFCVTWRTDCCGIWFDNSRPNTHQFISIYSLFKSDSQTLKDEEKNSLIFRSIYRANSDFLFLSDSVTSRKGRREARFGVCVKKKGAIISFPRKHDTTDREQDLQGAWKKRSNYKFQGRGKHDRSDRELKMSFPVFLLYTLLFTLVLAFIFFCCIVFPQIPL